MLRLPKFRFHQAASVEEAARLLAGEGAAQGEAVRVVAGGTDLWPNLKRRHQKASLVVSLSRLGALAGVENGRLHGGETRIGALTTLAGAAGDPLVRGRYPALARAFESISAPVLRNMGTVGGNLCLDTRCTYYNQNEEWRQSISYCMKAEGTVCWVAPGSPRCWAISASDSAPMLCALGARVKLVSAEGERTVPVEQLFQDDGIAYLAKRPDEILTDVFLPADAVASVEGAAPAEEPGACHSAFWKLRRRGSIDFAVLTAACTVWTDLAGLVTRARVFLGAVASFPTPATATADALVGKPLTAETIAAAAALARRDATPMDNTDFAAPWRGQMVARYVEAALRECAGLPTERLAPKHRL